MHPPTSEYRLRRRVQFYEVDGAGIVHFSWYFRYMEEAEHGLWRSAGLSIAPTRELAFPRVAATFEYRRPLRFEDEFDILIQIAAIGERNLEYRCTLTVGDTLIATGSMTIACVRMPEGEPLKRTPFPAHITSRFEAADAWRNQR